MSDNATKLINGRYRVVSQLGAGSYGVVYKAEDTVLQKVVALKMLNLQGANPKVLVRFQNEAKATAKLKHPNIVEVFDFNSDENGDYYLVLDFVQGKSLSSLIDEHGAMPILECYPLFVQLLDGLAHAHKNGVVHRDLNPNNILIDFTNPDSPLAKIVDFGLARLDNSEQHLTGVGVAIGTPSYMSPEQCRGQEPDARSDLYSFGCVMWTVLCGRPPYAADTAVDVIMSHINDQVPLLTEAEPDVEWLPGLPELIEKATERDPNKRFQSAEELNAQLQKIASPEAEQFASLVDSESSPESPKRSVANFFAISVVVILIASVSVLMLVKQIPIEPSDASRLAPAREEAHSNLSESYKLGNYENQVYGGMKEREFLPGPSEDQGPPQLKFELNRCYAANCFHDQDLKILVNAPHPIENLIIQKNSKITGSGFKYLKSLPLRRLELRDGVLTDWSLDQLPDSLKELKSLVISGNKGVKGTNIGALGRFPKLDDLDLSKTWITDADVPQLLNLPGLRDLNFSDCLKLKGKTIPKLANLKHLGTLNVSGTSLSLDYIDLEHFNALTRISACEQTISSKNIRSFLKGPALNALHLNDCAIHDDAIAIVAADPRIRDLSIRLCPDLTIASLRSLSSSNLEQLNYSFNIVGDEGIDCLLKMKNLKVLWLNQCKITEQQVRKLLQQKKLTQLYLAKTITQEQVDRLRPSFPETHIVLEDR